MRSFHTAALILFAGALAAQTPFQRVYPMTDAFWFTYGGTVDAEGNFVILQANSDKDVVLSRIAADGEHLWTRSYPLFTEEGFYGNSVVATSDGILIAGFTMGLGTNSRDGFVMKFDLDGNIVSQKRIDASSSNALHSLHKGTNGYFATGRTTGANNYDMLLAQIEEDGTMNWSKSYGVSSVGDHWDWARGGTQLSDGGYAVVGFGDGIGTTASAGYVVRTDADGNELWARAVSSGTSVEDINAVVEGSNGDIYLGGRGLGFISGDVTAFIVKLNSAGQYQWTRILEQGIEVADLKQGPNGGVTWLARPQFLPDGAGGYEMAWGQMAADGTTERMKVYGDVGNDWADNMEPLTGGGWAIFGSTNSHRDGNGNFSPFVLVIDADGNSDCWEIQPDMEWVNATAVVTPVTSTTGEGFQSFTMMTGTADVTAETQDPCCIVAADFEPIPGHTSLEWTFNNQSTGAVSYTWDFGDGNTSTEISPSHVYAANGAYEVCLTATADCGSVTTCITVSTSVGLGEAAGEAGLQLFPVPADELITLRATQRVQQVRVLDAEGRVALVINAAMRNELRITTEHLPKGLYLVEALLADGTMARVRAVVAH